MKRFIKLGICSLVFLLQIQSVSAKELNMSINESQSFVSAQKTTVKNGMVKDSDGIYRYYVNGIIDKSFTGIAQSSIDKKWYFLKEGVFSESTGLAKNPKNKRWYYVKKGIYDPTYTGVAKNQYGWFYVKNGEIDFTYTGVALRPENKGLFYIKDGKLDWSFTGLAKNHATGIWYYVEKGAVHLASEKTSSTSNKASLKGIDISNWQHTINLSEIEADFVIVKVSEGIGYVDQYYESYYQQAKKLGKKLGFYHFARPVSGNDPIKEARFFYDQTKQYYREALPILDWEADNPWNVQWAKKWLDEVYRLSGIKPVIYMNEYTENTYDWSPIVSAGYELWIAKYGQNLESINYDMSWIKQQPYLRFWNRAVMWQYTSNGKLQGYDGNLDLNIFNGDENAWNKLAGIPIIKTDLSYTGLAKNQYGWYYVKESIHDNTYTGLAKNQYGWFYVKNGRYDSKYTGVAKNQYGWFYVKNGKVDLTFTGLVKRPENGRWYYMKDGKLDRTYTGLAKNQYGWYKINKGAVDFSYTGLAKNQYGWYYVKNGKFDGSYTGLVKRPENNQWYYVTDGKWNRSYTGQAINPETGSWQKVENGVVQ